MSGGTLPRFLAEWFGFYYDLKCYRAVALTTVDLLCSLVDLQQFTGARKARKDHNPCFLHEQGS